MARHLPFTEMWELILRNHTQDTVIFPPELLIAIFWEETAFRNMRQEYACRDALPGHSPNPLQPCAVGFGQVRAPTAKSVYPEAFRRKSEVEVERLILSNDNLSVQTTSRALSFNFRMRGNKITALNEYATRSSTALSVSATERARSRREAGAEPPMPFDPVDHDMREAISRVAGWIACERALTGLNGLRGLPRSASSPQFRDAVFIGTIKASLRPLGMTKQRGFNPDIVFPPLGRLAGDATPTPTLRL